MAFDLNGFLADITNGSNIDEGSKQQLAAYLSNPTIAKRLEESAMRQSDYSSKMSDYQKKINAAQDYWNGLVEWDKKAKAELDAEKARVRAESGLDPLTPTVDGTVKKADIEKLASDALAYNNAITKISMQHLKEYGDVLDPNDLIKISQENGGINIHLAYEKYVQPKRDEKNRLAMETAIAQAREEGKAEALKNFAMPTEAGPFQSPNSQLDNLKTPATQGEYGQMAAVKAWREARAKGTPIGGF